MGRALTTEGSVELRSLRSRRKRGGERSQDLDLVRRSHTYLGVCPSTEDGRRAGAADIKDWENYVARLPDATRTDCPARGSAELRPAE
jgi:hypothetical protein